MDRQMDQQIDQQIDQQMDQQMDQHMYNYGEQMVNLTNEGFNIYNGYTNQNVNGDRFQ